MTGAPLMVLKTLVLSFLPVICTQHLVPCFGQRVLRLRENGKRLVFSTWRFIILASVRRYGVENLFKMDRKSPLGFLIVIRVSDET